MTSRLTACGSNSTAKPYSGTAARWLSARTICWRHEGCRLRNAGCFDVLIGTGIGVGLELSEPPANTHINGTEQSMTDSRIEPKSEIKQRVVIVGGGFGG